MNERPKDLHRSIEAARTLRLQIAAMVANGDTAVDPDLLGDEDKVALQDTFDGETTLDVELRMAVLAEDEDKIIIDGIKAREAELAERRRRAERRVEVRRGLMEQAMVIAGWTKQQFDVATVALAKAQPRVEIDHEPDLPSQFFKPQEPVLDKAGLRAVLLERHRNLEDALSIKDESERKRRLEAIEREHPPIPGAHLETGGVTLSIRRK